MTSTMVDASDSDISGLKYKSLIHDDPRFAEYVRVLSALNTAPPGRKVTTKELADYLDNEPPYTRLLREAILDEETYIWYAIQDCETKGYQWYQAALDKYLRLAVYALGAIQGLTIEQVDVQIKEAMKNLPTEDF